MGRKETGNHNQTEICYSLHTNGLLQFVSLHDMTTFSYVKRNSLNTLTGGQPVKMSNLSQLSGSLVAAMVGISEYA